MPGRSVAGRLCTRHSRSAGCCPELAGNLTSTPSRVSGWFGRTSWLDRNMTGLSIDRPRGVLPGRCAGRVFSRAGTTLRTDPRGCVCTAAWCSPAKPTSHAPDPACSCGFHALSNLSALNFMGGPLPRRNRGDTSLACLAVVLSGRVLAFDVAGRSGYGPVPRCSADSGQRGPLARLYTDRGGGVDCGASPGRFDPEPRVVAREGSRRPRRSAGRSPLVQPFGSGPVQLQLPSEPTRWR